MALATKHITNETLRSEMWRACDILRRDNNVGGMMQYTEHLAWLLFLKFLDEEEKRCTDLALLSGTTYEPVLHDDIAWDRWASTDALATWKADDLIAFVRGKLLPSLAKLNGSPLARTIRGIFSDETVGDQSVVRSLPVCASGHNLKDVLTIINRAKFDRDDDRYTIQLFYEALLDRMGSENRTAGEFHTPRSVIKFMVDVIAPRVSETVYDPAYGSSSAGFLAYAFRRVARTTSDFRGETLHGIEQKAFAALLGMMNMALLNASQAQLVRRNALEDAIDSDERCYDIVLTNPPFGGTEGTYIQENFPVRTSETKLLFMQHIIKKLKKTPNARAAIVVPEGTLFRSGAFAEVKRDLLDQFHLFAVVSLPLGTFAPYSDVKTALLFFKRPDEVLERNPLARGETLYYELPLPNGIKKFSKGSRVANEHFDAARELMARWLCYLQGGAERPATYAADIRTAWQAYHTRNTGRVVPDIVDQQPQRLQAQLPFDRDDQPAHTRKVFVADGSQPQPPYNVWIETLGDLKARGYDLSARNPNQNQPERMPHPAQITARLLEHTRELHALMEHLHAKLTQGEDKE